MKNLNLFGRAKAAYATRQEAKTEALKAEATAKAEEERFFVMVLQKFRKSYPAKDGWKVSIDVDADSQRYVGRVLKGNDCYSVASVECKDGADHMATEREAIMEAIIRFGVEIDFDAYFQSEPEEKSVIVTA
jgi:hypothetical protein